MNTTCYILIVGGIVICYMLYTTWWYYNNVRRIYERAEWVRKLEIDLYRCYAEFLFIILSEHTGVTYSQYPYNVDGFAILLARCKRIISEIQRDRPNLDPIAFFDPIRQCSDVFSKSFDEVFGERTIKHETSN